MEVIAVIFSNYFGGGECLSCKCVCGGGTKPPVLNLQSPIWKREIVKWIRGWEF